MTSRSDCDKVAYSTERAAKRALRKCQKKKHGEERVYQCELCHLWHLTSRATVDYTTPGERRPYRRKKFHVEHDLNQGDS